MIKERAYSVQSHRPYTLGYRNNLIAAEPSKFKSDFPTCCGDAGPMHFRTHAIYERAKFIATKTRQPNRLCLWKLTKIHVRPHHSNSRISSHLNAQRSHRNVQYFEMPKWHSSLLRRLSCALLSSARVEEKRNMATQAADLVLSLFRPIAEPTHTHTRARTAIHRDEK